MVNYSVSFLLSVSIYQIDYFVCSCNFVNHNKLHLHFVKEMQILSVCSNTHLTTISHSVLYIVSDGTYEKSDPQ